MVNIEEFFDRKTIFTFLFIIYISYLMLDTLGLLSYRPGYSDWSILIVLFTSIQMIFYFIAVLSFHNEKNSWIIFLLLSALLGAWNILGLIVLVSIFIIFIYLASFKPTIIFKQPVFYTYHDHQNFSSAKKKIPNFFIALVPVTIYFRVLSVRIFIICSYDYPIDIISDSLFSYTNKTMLFVFFAQILLYFSTPDSNMNIFRFYSKNKIIVCLGFWCGFFLSTLFIMDQWENFSAITPPISAFIFLFFFNEKSNFNIDQTQVYSIRRYPYMQYKCIACGNNLNYMGHYRRYYCTNCGIWF